MQDPIKDQPQAVPPVVYPPPQDFTPGYPAPGYPMQQPYPQPVVTSQTVVVTTQPQQVVTQRGWSSGMCDCFNDFGSCLMGFMCPHILLCQISSRMGEGCCFATCCPGALISLRVKLRADNSIEGNLCDDHISANCCPLLTLCQMSRELDHITTYQR